MSAELQNASELGTNCRNSPKELVHLARFLEDAAFDLAGRVPQTLVASLILCANDLESIADQEA